MTKEKAASTQSPAYEARLNHVRVTIWQNVNKGSKFYNTVITRRYRDGDEFKETNTFSGLGDLALLGEAVNLAQLFIRDITMKNSDTNTEDYEN
jgi:hypothetical protein